MSVYSNCQKDLNAMFLGRFGSCLSFCFMALFLPRNLRSDALKRTFEYQSTYHGSINWGHYFYVSDWRKDRHSSQAKVQLFAGQRQLATLFLRPWLLIRPWGSNPRHPALQSSALQTEVVPPRLASLTDELVLPRWVSPSYWASSSAVS